MKKRIISLLLMLVMAVGMVGGTSHGALSDYPIPEYGAIEEVIASLTANGLTLTERLCDNDWRGIVFE